MLNRDKVIQSLAEKQTQFQTFWQEQQHERDEIARSLQKFLRLDNETVLTRLDQLGLAWPGAYPTAELDQADELRLTFGQRWQSHQEARRWALSVLEDAPVLAVDGSQITPSKDFSIPVGAVQIGWFINDHRIGGSYVKDITFEVISPKELYEAEGDTRIAVDTDFPNWYINQQRFVGECERICTLMAEYAHVPLAQRPLCFFDGSLIISFAGQLRPSRAAGYLQAVQKLLDCSNRYRVPLVGFVDGSQSRDMVKMMGLVVAQDDIFKTSDASLLAGLLPEWGDRSPLFVCARDDQLSREGYAPFYQQVAFTYVRLSADRYPARVEMPLWMAEDDYVPAIIDLVRAECVVGGGYPYAVETADAVAVISYKDQQRFYALLQQFAEQEGIALTLARKAMSKQSRR